MPSQVSLLLLLAGCAGNEPCYRFCSDLAQVYTDLIEGSGASTEGLPGYGGGTEFSEASYLDACDDAPEGRSCEECSAWYFENFLEAANIAGDCDIAYGRAPATSDDGQSEARCEDTCDTEGLRY